MMNGSVHKTRTWIGGTIQWRIQDFTLGVGVGWTLSTSGEGGGENH